MGPVKSFLLNENGGATVEWIVLTAVLMLGGLYATDIVGTKMQMIAMQVQTQLAELQIPTTFADFKTFAARGTF